MPKISVILATFNEEKNIAACLKTVTWADEIIVVDGSSTDKTVAIAKKFTPNVLVRENPLMFHKNKQLAINKAGGDWILYLDADERVSPKLKLEIQKVIQNNDINGYWIPRKNIIFGQWIRHTGWYPDYKLRLFKNGKAYLPCKSVHEEPVLNGKAGYLNNNLIHYNYQNIHQFVRKLNNLYTQNDRDVFLSSGKKIYWQDALRFPVSDFLKRYFLEEGYKDGLHGLNLSLFQAFMAFTTFAKIWEKEGFASSAPANTLSGVAGEFKRIGKEFNYWLLTAKMNNSRSIIRKGYFRLLRKLSR